MLHTNDIIGVILGKRIISITNFVILDTLSVTTDDKTKYVIEHLMLIKHFPSRHPDLLYFTSYRLSHPSLYLPSTSTKKAR